MIEEVNKIRKTYGETLKAKAEVKVRSNKDVIIKEYDLPFHLDEF